MATELDIIGQEDPLYAASIKGYNNAELLSLIGYLDQSMAWMQSKNLHVEGEDVVAFRIGVPYLGSDLTVDASTVYESDDNLDRLIASLSLDMLKFTVKSTDDTLRDYMKAESYTYKSQYIHKIFGEYFIDGVDNQSGLTYLDGVDVSLSKLGSIPVEYGGIVQTPPIIPQEIPDYVIKAFTYMVQNPFMSVVYWDEEGVENPEYVKKGDTIYFSSKAFFDGLAIAKYKAETKTDIVTEEELPLTTDDAITKIFEFTELTKSFEDTQYGGLIEDMRLILRFPASRGNQEQLEALLQENFEDVFKEQFIKISDKDVDESMRELDLKDEYSTEKTDEYSRLDDSESGHYGCHRTTAVNDNEGYSPEDPEWFPTYEEDYRYWYISDAWLQQQSAEVISILFWLGLDVDYDMDTNPCPYDQALTIVIIIVMTIITIFTLGAASTATGAVAATISAEAAAIASAIAIAGAIVSIGVTTGAIDAKTGKKLGIALAIISLNPSQFLTMGLNVATLNFVVMIANTALSIVELKELDVTEEIDRLTAEQAKLEDAAKENENSIRVQLGGYQDMHISKGCEMDYEKYLKDTYDRYSPYTGTGFRYS